MISPASWRATTGLALAVSLAWAIGPSALLAQGPDSDPTQDPATSLADRFGESVDVEVVNIDVYVVDADGEPVRGLGAEDFQVEIDGRTLPITNFYAVAQGRRTGATAASDRSDEVPGTPSDDSDSSDSASDGPRAFDLDLEPIATPPEQRLWMVVYVDNFFVKPLERNRALPGIHAFLDRNLRPGDRAMVVSHARSIDVRQPFTDNLGALHEAIDTLEDDAGFASARQREQADTLQALDRSNDPQRALAHARSYAESQMNEVEVTAESLRRFVESLSGLPGRKALVYVSSGVPRNAGEEMFQTVAEKYGTSEAFSEIARHDTGRRFEAVARLAAASRVTFYTLDAGGLRGSRFGAAEYGEFTTPGVRSMLDTVTTENGQAPLRLLAEETGGRMIANRNDLSQAIAELASDFGDYYSLGVSPAQANYGRWHDIEVTLVRGDDRDRRKYRLRHREGYRSRRLEERVEDGLRSALLYDYEANPLGLSVRRLPTERVGDELRVPFEIQVPMESLVLLPRGDGKHEMALQLSVGVVDARQKFSAIDRVPLGLRLDEQYLEAARRERFRHVHRLVMEPGRHKVAFAILDRFGRQVSIDSLAIDP